MVFISHSKVWATFYFLQVLYIFPWNKNIIIASVISKYT